MLSSSGSIFPSRLFLSHRTTWAAMACRAWADAPACIRGNNWVRRMTSTGLRKRERMQDSLLAAAASLWLCQPRAERLFHHDPCLMTLTLAIADVKGAHGCCMLGVFERRAGHLHNQRGKADMPRGAGKGRGIRQLLAAEQQRDLAQNAAVGP